MTVEGNVLFPKGIILSSSPASVYQKALPL
jgi:hypothetical protein